MGWDVLWVWCHHRSNDCSLAHRLPSRADDAGNDDLDDANDDRICILLAVTGVFEPFPQAANNLKMIMML